MRYKDLLNEGYKEAERDFSAASDLEKVRDAIQKYRYFSHKKSHRSGSNGSC